MIETNVGTSELVPEVDESKAEDTPLGAVCACLFELMSFIALAQAQEDASEEGREQLARSA